MEGKYYHDPNIIGEVWGIPTDIFAGLMLFVMLAALFMYGTWDWWALKTAVWKESRRKIKRLKSGKGIIRSFIIEVAGKELTQSKFVCITNDINSILEGKLLAEVCKRNKGCRLDVNNVVGITDIPVADNHLFVIWYREV